MLMREWRRDSGLPRWWMERRTLLLLRALGIASACYSIVIVVTLLLDDGKEPSAPWLPTSGRVGWFMVLFTALMVTAGTVGLILGIRDRKKRRGEPFFRFPQWPNPESSYQLGVRWSLTGWRLATFGLILYAPCIPWTWLAFTMPEGKPLFGEMPWWNAASVMDVWILVHALFFQGYCFVLKGREVRRGKEQIRVADEYLAIREMRLNAEVEATFEKFLQEQQDWRAQKTAELYQQILDQQARGLLPCPNCHGHRESA